MKVVISDGGSGSGVGGVVVGLGILGLGIWLGGTYPLTCITLGGLAVLGKVMMNAAPR